MHFHLAVISLLRLFSDLTAVLKSTFQQIYEQPLTAKSDTESTL